MQFQKNVLPLVINKYYQNFYIHVLIFQIPTSPTRPVEPPAVRGVLCGYAGPARGHPQTLSGRHALPGPHCHCWSTTRPLHALQGLYRIHICL